MSHSSLDPVVHELRSWNEGRMLGAKRALELQQVWAIRLWLDHHRRLRDRALFDLAIDSKLRGCDVVKIRIGDSVAGGPIRNLAMVIQQKTKRPVQFEIVDPARKTLPARLERRMNPHRLCVSKPQQRYRPYEHSPVRTASARMGDWHRFAG